MPPTVEQIAEAMCAKPGDFPRASPNSETAIECFYHMLHHCTSGDVEKVKAFAQLGGVRAVVGVLEETADESDRKAEKLAASEKMEMNKDVKHLLMLADLHTMGVSLLSNLGSVAEDGEATTLAELKAAKAVAIVSRSLRLYPDNPDHAEAGMAALSQLLPLDPEGFAAAGFGGVKPASVVISAMKNPKASPWLLYLGARTLARYGDEGGDTAKQSLQEEGAMEALKMACRAEPGDATCGAEWGVKDVSAKLQVFARTCIAKLIGFSGFSHGGRTQQTLAVNLFLLQDPVVLANMDDPAVGKGELNGSIGVVVGAAEGDVGPVAASGLYGVRLEFPEEKRGQTVELNGANMRLLAPLPQAPPQPAAPAVGVQ